MLRFNPITGEVELAPTFSQRPGIPGLNGRDGKDGLDGANGRNGRDGQDAAPATPGTHGKNGRDGQDGNTLLHGMGPPGPQQGRTNDFYIDIKAWHIYGPKRSDGSWSAGVSLTGPPGKRGEDGTDGKDGVDGKNGVDGKDGKDGKIGPAGERGPRGFDGLTVSKKDDQPLRTRPTMEIR